MPSIRLPRDADWARLDFTTRWMLWLTQCPQGEGEDDFARDGEAGPPPRQGRSRRGHGRVSRDGQGAGGGGARGGQRGPAEARLLPGHLGDRRRTIGPQPSPRARGECRVARPAALSQSTLTAGRRHDHAGFIAAAWQKSIEAIIETGRIVSYDEKPGIQAIATTP